MVIHSDIGNYIAMARNDRHSWDSYIGSITDENALILDLAAVGGQAIQHSPTDEDHLHVNIEYQE